MAEILADTGEVDGLLVELLLGQVDDDRLEVLGPPDGPSELRPRP